jgi:hypothetical protein
VKIEHENAQVILKLDQPTAYEGWLQPGWKAALNAFDITFDGRLSAGRK